MMEAVIKLFLIFIGIGFSLIPIGFLMVRYNGWLYFVWLGLIMLYCIIGVLFWSIPVENHSKRDKDE